MNRRSVLTAAVSVAVTPAFAGCMSDADDAGDDVPTDDGGADEAASDDDTAASDADTNGASDADGEAAEFETEVRAPTEAELGEEFDIVVEVHNAGEQAGSFGSTLYVRSTTGPEPVSWETVTLSAHVDAGETVTVREPLAVDIPSVVYYRVGSGGQVRTVDIPGSRAPIIAETALVSDWRSFGDLEANQLDTASAGDIIGVAHQHWAFVHDGTLAVFEQVDVYHDGARVDSQTVEDEQIFDTVGWQRFEHALFFDTTEWDVGQYTAEIRLRDDVTGDVSRTATLEFDVE